MTMMMRRQMMQQAAAEPYTALDQFSTWIEKKSIQGNGNVASNNDVMYCDAYLDVSEYAQSGYLVFEDRTDNNGFFVGAGFYKSDKSWKSRNAFISGSPTLKVSIPSDAVYFRILLVYKINGTAVTATVANVPLDKLFIKHN